MTDKLFYEDSHLAEFEAVVQSCEQKSDKYLIVLDRTAFFPEGGGQAADTGVLNGVPVSDVQEKEGVIFHTADEAIVAGTAVHGVINWDERFSKMQQHSGEHIVSGIVHEWFGYNNVGFHLGNENVTLDFDGILTKEQLREVEYEANRAIAKNLDILVDYPEKELLQTMEYRSKIEIQGQVRIVTIPGYDVCACCAPHVKKTGEIGMIKLVSMQNYKGGVRISMRCGFRALADYCEKEASVHAISHCLSAKEDKITEAVEHLKEENFRLNGTITALQRQVFAYRAEKVEQGAKRVILFEEALEGSAMRELCNLILERAVGVCAVCCGNDKEGYKYVIGSHKLDVREIAKELNGQFAGRGGGKKDMVQGSLYGSQKAIKAAFHV